MTATQHTPVLTDADDLPRAIRNLEAARPGDLAYAPGGSPCAMKMEPDSGRPWLLDPWGHDGAPSRVTTPTLAQMNYRTIERERERPAPEEPTSKACSDHAEALLAAGWSAPMLAEAAGVHRGVTRRFLNGIYGRPETIQKILAVSPDDPLTPNRPSARERAEDVEWLLDSGVAPQPTIERCGFVDLDTAVKQLRRAGRADVAGRLLGGDGSGDASKRRRRGRGKPPSSVTSAQEPTLAALREMGPATLSDLAEALSLTNEGVRHHLEILVRAGVATRQTAGPGRASIYTAKEN